MNQRLTGALATGGSAFAIQAVGAILAFVVQLVFARVLGAEQYGAFAFYFSLAIIAGIWGRLGSDVVVMRLGGIAQERGQLHSVRNLLSHGQCTALVGSLLAGMVVTLTVVLVELPASKGVMLASVALLTVIVAVNGVWQAALIAVKRPVLALSPDQVLRPIIALVAVALYIVLSAGRPLEPSEALAILAMAALIALFAMIKLGRTALPLGITQRSDSLERRRLVRLGLSLMTVYAAYLLAYYADTLVLGFWLSPEAIGPYQVAKQVAQLGLFGMIAIQHAQSPQIAGYVATNSGVELGRQIRFIRLAGAGFAAAVLIGFAAFGNWFLSFFGAAFGSAYQLALVLLVGQLAVALIGPAGILATMSGNQGVATIVYASGALIMLIVGPVAIGRAGPMGAALVQTSITVTCAIAIRACVRARVPALR